MLEFLKKLILFFSPYVNFFEKKVNKFFQNIKSTDNIISIREKLLLLMQKNLIVVNIWLEKKYKGYKYLKKSTRRKMYSDAEKIVKCFSEFSSKNTVSDSFVKKILAEKDLSFPVGNEEKIKYLAQIMDFLKPGAYYKYIKTASFGKLLRDPYAEKLEGDCNQIVTLYAFLYSLKFSLNDLQIKLLPEHVCLHFKNIDIEATNGTFQKYKESKQVLPITEIISTNLLDLADFREELVSVSPRAMVKSAQLAYAISSLKELVAKNLTAAYHNLGVAALNAKDFETAIFYFEKAGERDILKKTYYAAAQEFMKSNQFPKARFYADKSGDSELKRVIRYNEGIYFYEHDKIDDALQVFNELGEEKMKKACYGKKYNMLAGQVSNVRTLADAKNKRHVYKKMLELAQKMGDSGLEKNLRDTLSRI